MQSLQATPVYMMTWVFSPSMDRNPDLCSPSLMYAGKKTVPSLRGYRVPMFPCSKCKSKDVVKQRERPPTGSVHFGSRLLEYTKTRCSSVQIVTLSSIYDRRTRVSIIKLSSNCGFAKGYGERLRLGSEESGDFRLTLYSSPGVHI